MLTIRRGGPDDVVHLASLRFEWRSRERGEKGLDQQSFEKELKEWTREHENSHVPFLAFETERPVGMAWLAVVDRIPRPEFFVRRSGYVQSVYVVPNQRSQGVGTALMVHLVGYARNAELDYLAVHPSEKSFEFYRRLGFAPTTQVLELR